MHRNFGFLTCYMKLMSLKQCNVGSPKKIVRNRDKSCSDRLERCELLSLESRRIERDMYAVFKLIRGLHGLTLEEAGLFLCNSITRGSGMHLK